ncbi:GDYXXLXY domain-containing protein [uncultured Exiguobacterium sp.]|uniref:GDYXXLXY domain-containing protein n=1 Tax=uncultured Exiguobacterium sp. TaxID=202669 RepID=UPI0025F19701|nr:GDYXXLXY domain-containing protein [uncultured Exiguobacterium sp.]
MKRYLMPILQTCAVGLLIVSFFSTSWFGTSYRFRAEPFDPFDPVYGEYVMLQYPDLKPDPTIQNGRVYVSFKTDASGYAQIDRISNERFFGSVAGDYYDQYVSIPQLTQYYGEQGSGKQYEKAKALEVRADVSPWGTIRTTNLKISE